MSDKILDKAGLLSGVLLRRELVPIPGRGASIWLREISATHVIEFKKYIEQFKANGIKETTFEQDIEIMALVVSFSACDESGNLLFATPDEAKGLTVNGAKMLADLGNKALAISGIVTGAGGLTSEVTDTLPNEVMTSSLGNLPKSSRKRGKKS
jgi:hypothetical protein